MEYTKWTAMWGNAMSIHDNRPETHGRNLTLRYRIFAPFEGSALRFTFDNCCGTEPITINKASVAESAGQMNAKEGTFRLLSFGGEPCVTVPAGEKVVSDPVEFDVRAGSKLTVSFYLKDFTQLRSAVVTQGPLSKAWYSVGDMTEEANPDLWLTKSIRWWFFLSEIDVLTLEENHAVICYGDSITAQDWPDHLAQLLWQQGDRHMSVVRRAASGTRILREYTDITYESYGLKGVNRVPREFECAGADTVIIQQGINDIIHPVGVDVNPYRPWSDLPKVSEMTAGIAWYIEEARKFGYKVYLGTLLPILGWRTYAEFREQMKNEFNDWLRQTDLADGVVDFHKAVEDPADPRAFAPGYDSGDHLHPSSSCYKQMAEEAADVLTGRK